MSNRARNILLIVLAVIVAFGVGAAWQFTAARAARQQLQMAEAERDQLRADLALQRLEATLALAALAAQLGNYERGRQLASDFFSGLQDSITAAPDNARTPLEQVLGTRDNMITQLSRADPGSGLQLSRILVQYREALGRDGAGLAPAISDSVGR